jgi:hypothetical protein
MITGAAVGHEQPVADGRIVAVTGRVLDPCPFARQQGFEFVG